MEEVSPLHGLRRRRPSAAGWPRELIRKNKHVKVLACLFFRISARGTARRAVGKSRCTAARSSWASCSSWSSC